VRFRSDVVGGYRVFAVAGVNTVSFGIDRSGADVNGLLGFAVERIDPARKERYFMRGFKVFPSVIRYPDQGTVVSTYEHPVQSLVWDDFTARPDAEFTYLFHPLKGTPKNLDRSSEPIPITVHTESLFSRGTHDVFFNRGVTSSQAYAKRFHNRSPAKQPTAKLRQDALNWLSRDLDDALLAFIRGARPGDSLRGCFYEFRAATIAEEFGKAIQRGVDVQIIVDAKVNEHFETRGGKKVKVESFPRVANLATIKAAGLPDAAILLREARTDHFAHNKFIVRLTGGSRTPTEVWTGSTNLSDGGIYGQANVGHWVRDGATARAFLAYWTLLSADPGGRDDDDVSTVRRENATLRSDVEALTAIPATVDDIPNGLTQLFSPRSDLAALDLYVSLMDEAKDLACGTLAFGITAALKARLATHTAEGPLTFLLLEKADKPRKGSAKAFVRLNSRNNVYEAWGSELDNPLAQWVRETNNLQLGLNTHVVYMHCKFMLHDPLGADPIVATGSANFSEDSIKENDENMILIRGDRRVADIYFTEFNRLFNHYYFRSVVEATKRFVEAAEVEASNGPAAGGAGGEDEQGNLFLTENDGWLKKYFPTALRQKRVNQYVEMAGIE
jgi:phosphatidylserine/phosphatidylglycerophosphate/cardiolipin synthase-like enzyme